MVNCKYCGAELSAEEEGYLGSECAKCDLSHSGENVLCLKMKGQSSIVRIKISNPKILAGDMTFHVECLNSNLYLEGRFNRMYALSESLIRKFGTDVIIN